MPVYAVQFGAPYDKLPAPATVSVEPLGGDRYRVDLGDGDAQIYEARVSARPGYSSVSLLPEGGGPQALIDVEWSKDWSKDAPSVRAHGSGVEQASLRLTPLAEPAANQQE